MRKRWLILVLCILAQSAQAATVERLRAFVRETQTARASFTQTVTDRNGKPVDVGQPMPMGDDGKMLMAVPNKPLAAGTYKVKWQAVAPDGKPLEGEFSFTAQ